MPCNSEVELVPVLLNNHMSTAVTEGDQGSLFLFPPPWHILLFFYFLVKPYSFWEVGVGVGGLHV